MSMIEAIGRFIARGSNIVACIVLTAGCELVLGDIPEKPQPAGSAGNAGAHDDGGSAAGTGTGAGGATPGSGPTGGVSAGGATTGEGGSSSTGFADQGGSDRLNDDA